MTGDSTEPSPPEDEIHDPADARENAAAETEAADEVAPAIEKGGDREAEKSAGRGRGEATWLKRCLTIRDEPSALERFGAGVLCIVVVLLVWHLLTMGDLGDRLVNRVSLPSLTETIKSFPDLWMDRALARSAVWSVGRVLGGFALAAAIAVPLGVLAGCYFRLHAFLKPVSIFGRNIPIAALIPLTMIWFGLGETQKVMFITIASGAFIFFDTTNAVHSVSNRFLDTAYTLGARFVGKRNLGPALVWALIYAVIATIMMRFSKDTMTWASPAVWIGTVAGAVVGFGLWLPILSHQAISKVLLPLALPNIVNSLRLLFGLAFGYIMLAELINAGHGLGHLILTSQRRGMTEHIFLCLIFIALLAFAIDRTVFWLQRKWFPYKYTSNG